MDYGVEEWRSQVHRDVFYFKQAWANRTVVTLAKHIFNPFNLIAS